MLVLISLPTVDVGQLAALVSAACAVIVLARPLRLRMRRRRPKRDD